MKNSWSVLLVAVLLAVIAYSCKSHERCPAYGKATTTETVKRV
jgi:hypothetical protein